MLKVRVALLGVPVVEHDGSPIAVDTRKAIALLAYLAAHEGSQSRDSLANLLWPELDEQGARAAFRRTLSSLKSGLREDVLRTDRRTVLLLRDRMDIDLDRFRSALQKVRGHGHALRAACSECLPLLEHTVNLHRGDFMAGFSLRDAGDFDDWQLLQAESLRRDLGEALEGIVESLAQVARLDEAISYAQRWLALDQLQEASHRALMRLYHAKGERALALRQYRECVRILQEELAVEPVEETARLYASIKEGETGGPVVTSPLATIPLPASSGRLPLLGRTAEWDTLVQALDRSAAGGYIAAIEGEAGIGKTRLLREILEHNQASGAATV